MDQGVRYGPVQDRAMPCNGLRSAEQASQPSLSIISQHKTANTSHSDIGMTGFDSSMTLLLTPPPRALVRGVQRNSLRDLSGTVTRRNTRSSRPVNGLNHALENVEKTIVPQLGDQSHENDVQSPTFPSLQSYEWTGNALEVHDESLCEASSTASTKKSSPNRPRFLSDEAEFFWDAFGGTDPSQIGSILHRANQTGSTMQDWIIICSATADPVIRELVAQLHILNQELSSVLTGRDRPHATQLKVCLRSGPAWRYEFPVFRYQTQLEDWRAKFDKLCLLHHEYQLIEAQLETQRSSMRFKPNLVVSHLRNIKQWRAQLDAEMETTLRMSQHTKQLTGERKEEVDPSNANATDKSSVCWNKRHTATLAQSSSRSMGTRSKSSFGGNIKPRLRSFAHLGAYGTQRAAYSIASFLALFATLATILSVRQCAPATGSLYADSNFWSTCSQTFLGLGGIYCLLIPILQNTQLDVSKPNLFKWLLVASFVAAVAAVAVYHSQIQTSLVFALISGLAGLAATLLLVKDAGNQIVEKTAQVEWLEDEVVRLRANRSR